MKPEEGSLFKNTEGSVVHIGDHILRPSASAALALLVSDKLGGGNVALNTPFLRSFRKTDRYS